jgi:hypothetical protein
MSRYQVTAGELVYLLNAAGAERPFMMEAGEFAAGGAKPAAPQADGKTLAALAQALATPQIVVRVWRRDGRDEPVTRWFYWSADSAVGFRQTDGGSFELSEIAGKEAVLSAIGDLLAVRPVPADLDFYAVVQREDFLAVRDLADVWDQVPALDIIQADGLDKVTAEELFDVAAEPEWRAQVNFSGIRDDGKLVERVARVAQGANSAWMAVPVDEEIRQIRVETVQAGEVAALLLRYWDEVRG